MGRKFSKYHGAGNDFIIINNIDGAIPESVLPELAAGLCAQHVSVGADGMMVVAAPRQGGDFRMIFYNSDGSLGEMCGNGARCICRYGFEHGYAGSVQRVETTAGLVIGWRIADDQYRIRLNTPAALELQKPLDVDGRTYRCSYVELGAPGIPHLAVQTPDLAGQDEAALDELEHAYPSIYAGRGANDAWMLLARIALAFKKHKHVVAREALARLLRAYPTGAVALIRQNELPDGEFARLSVQPYSEDELVVALSESVVLLQEGNDPTGRGILGTWIAENTAVLRPSAVDEARRLEEQIQAQFGQQGGEQF